MLYAYDKFYNLIFLISKSKWLKWLQNLSYVSEISHICANITEQ